ncbi:hypothetical protein JOF41_005715 [Saccharothrix coeruleofusca]|nr:hypothetical protein [Saccharothrix coeruleofusca]MBP2339537.1 hypothetical protein [Saccharothrix coeruleofusca]
MNPLRTPVLAAAGTDATRRAGIVGGPVRAPERPADVASSPRPPVRRS